MIRKAEDFCLAAAVNDHGILASCLRRSPDVAEGRLELKIYEGYSSAASALNAGLDGSTAPIVIFAHQDVYLPRGWLGRLAEEVARVEAVTPNWAVLGLYGRDLEGAEVGRVWSSGLGREAGRGGFAPTPALTMDELLLVVRRDAGLRFDERLPGFHLYATDIVTEGRMKGLTSFVIDAPVVHNSRPTRTLKGAYSRAWYYMQRKWWSELPITTLVCDIRRLPIALWRARFAGMKLYRRNRGRPPRDAVEIARALNYE